VSNQISPYSFLSGFKQFLLSEMPPKKKQKKDNGYMVFMKYMKPQLESQGHRFPRGLSDVIPVCNPLWNVRQFCFI
jgi:hypothetical protein